MKVRGWIRNLCDLLAGKSDLTLIEAERRGGKVLEEGLLPPGDERARGERPLGLEHLGERLRQRLRALARDGRRGEQHDDDPHP